MRDLYEVLEVERQASSADLKKAYYRLAKKYHPDHNPGDQDAEDKFKEASNAYSILSDDEQRQRYDRFGIEGVRGMNGAAQGYSNVEDILSAFGDIFGDFFGGRGGRRQPRGADIQVDLQLTFAEAVWGTTKDIKVARNAVCATCTGSGATPGSKPEICRTCQGKGQVVHAQGFFMVQAICPQCRGAGKSIKEPCEDCRGRGTKPETTTIKGVKIPPGVDNGLMIQVPGEGAVVPGGTPGNLQIVLHVQGDERFKREGEDVLTEVPVSFVKAALGGEIEVYTLDESCQGSTTIELKPGTQPEEIHVRRGQGIPRLRGAGRGNQVLQFKIEIPRKLTQRQEELMRELAGEFGEVVRPEKRGLFSRKK